VKTKHTLPYIALGSVSQGLDQKHIVLPPHCNFNSVASWITAEEKDEGRPVEEHEYYQHEWKYHKGDFIAHIAGTDHKITTAHMLLQDAA